MSEKGKDLTFPELQKAMQLEKKRNQNVSYSSRSAEDIFSLFKIVNTDWVLKTDVVFEEFGGRLFMRSTASVKRGDELHEAKAFAEYVDVPLTKSGAKQMQSAQWTGATQSYAIKYALQNLFAIGEADLDQMAPPEPDPRQEYWNILLKSSRGLASKNGAKVESVAKRVMELSGVTWETFDKEGLELAIKKISELSEPKPEPKVAPETKSEQKTETRTEQETEGKPEPEDDFPF